MKKLALVAALLVAVSSSAMAQNWYYTNNFDHPTWEDSSLPNQVNNINGQVGFTQARNENTNTAGAEYTWIRTDTGADVTGSGYEGNTAMQMVRNDATKRYYWDGDYYGNNGTWGYSYIPAAVANQGSVNTYAIEMKFKVDDLSFGGTSQNQGIVFFQGYSELTAGTTSSWVGQNNVRLLMARGKRAGDSGSGNQWTDIQDPATSNKYFIYDYFKNLDYYSNEGNATKGTLPWDPSSYIECTIGEWYTLKVVQSVQDWNTGMGDRELATKTTTDIWLNGTLVQHWTGKQIPTGAGIREVSFGYSNAKNVTSTISYDYLKVGTVPEPGSILAMASGLVGLVGFGLRKRH